jgi:WD40 repeat protein
MQQMATVTFHLAQEIHTYTESKLYEFLQFKLGQRDAGIRTNNLLFFGIAEVNNRTLGNKTVKDTLFHVLQLRNQHNILLFGFTYTWLYNFKTRKTTPLEEILRVKSAVQLEDGFVALVLNYTTTKSSITLYDPVTLSKQSKHKLNIDKNWMICSESLKHGLYAISWLNTIEIRDAYSMKPIRHIRGHDTVGTARDNITSLLELSNETLASSSFDKTVRIWNVTSGECLHVLRGHTEYVWGLVEYGNYLVSSGLDLTMRFWNVEEEECHRVVTTNDCLRTLYVKPDNTIVGLSYRVSYYRYNDNKFIVSNSIKCPNCVICLTIYDRAGPGDDL